MLAVLLVCVYIQCLSVLFFFFFSSRRRHTRLQGDWSSDVCSSDLRARRAQGASRQAWLRGHRGQHDGRLRSDEHEIGRASCRERSVDLGGRRIIKKKKKKKRKRGTT